MARGDSPRDPEVTGYANSWPRSSKRGVLLREYMQTPIKLHTFILEDENQLPQQVIDALAEETAHRRAEDIGWTSIVVQQLPVRVEENGKTLYVFEIFGFGEALEDEDDVVALIASQGPTSENC